MKKSKLNNIECPWTKFYPEGLNFNLKYSDSSMVGYFLEAVARYPENIAYEFYGYTCTFREMYEKIRDAAKALKAQGIKKAIESLFVCQIHHQLLLCFMQLTWWVQ